MKNITLVTSIIYLGFLCFPGVVEFGRDLTKDGERYTEGNLDEFVVFNEEFSADEIALLATP